MATSPCSSAFFALFGASRRENAAGKDRLRCRSILERRPNQLRQPQRHRRLARTETIRVLPGPNDDAIALGIVTGKLRRVIGIPILSQEEEHAQFRKVFSLVRGQVRVGNPVKTSRGKPSVEHLDITVATLVPLVGIFYAGIAQPSGNDPAMPGMSQLVQKRSYVRRDGKIKPPIGFGRRLPDIKPDLVSPAVRAGRRLPSQKTRIPRAFVILAFNENLKPDIVIPRFGIKITIRSLPFPQSIRPARKSMRGNQLTNHGKTSPQDAENFLLEGIREVRILKQGRRKPNPETLDEVKFGAVRIIPPAMDEKAGHGIAGNIRNESQPLLNPVDRLHASVEKLPRPATGIQRIARNDPVARKDQFVLAGLQPSNNFPPFFTIFLSDELHGSQLVNDGQALVGKNPIRPLPAWIGLKLYEIPVFK